MAFQAKTIIEYFKRETKKTSRARIHTIVS